MNTSWDKELAHELRKKGLTHEQAMIVVGIVAEERQIANRLGYIRGYNDGYRDAETKYNK